MYKYRYGNSEINYGRDGRPDFLPPRESTFPKRQQPAALYSSHLPQQTGYPTRTYDFDRDRNRGRNLDRVNSGPYRNDLPTDQYYSQQRKSTGPPHQPPPPLPRTDAGIDYIRPGLTMPMNAPRRDDPWHSPILPGKNYDREELIDERKRSQSLGSRKKGRKRRTCFYRWMHEWPVSVLYVIVGLLLIGVGIANILFCSANHGYSPIWIGALSLLTGGIGLIHRGKYKNGLASKEYFGSAILLSIAAAVGLGYILHTYSPFVKKFVLAGGDATVYAKAEGIMEMPNKAGLENMTVETSVLMCFGLDTSALALLLMATTALLSACVVIEKHWTEKHIYLRRIIPFCDPMFFNPFVQVGLGHLMVVLGLLTVFVCEGSKWGDYWSPVWTGGLTVLAGFVGALAERRADSKPKNRLNILMQYLSFAGSVIAVVLCTMAMVDVIKALEVPPASNSVDVSRRLISSACFYAVAEVPCLMNIFYTLVNLVKSIQVIMGRASTTESRSEINKSAYSQSIPSVDGGKFGGPTMNHGYRPDFGNYWGRY